MQLHRQDRETKALSAEIGELPLLAAVAPRALDAVAATGRVVHLPKGWAMMSEDTPADSGYLILEGEAQVRHGGEVIAALGRGSLVGEAAIVQRRRRNATVVTATEVRALRVGYEDLGLLFTRFPELEQVVRSEWDRKQAGVSPAS